MQFSRATKTQVFPALLFLALPTLSNAAGPYLDSCKSIPGDAGWPKKADWDQLNSTVHGRLIATVPNAHVCHDPTYDAAACATLKKDWDGPQAHIFTAGEICAPIFQNQTCDPFTPQSTPCTLGNYASFSINVTGTKDVVAGIQFSQDKNVRLVVKNTGHDYLGKSTGKGSLALWTHNLKDIKLLESYHHTYYAGPAMKVGAGVITAEAYLAAHNAGYRVVGGTCPTVGIAGGYSQGGGHSLLSSLYGLGADNVLEWEVVTATGKHLVATPTENSDLYWALSGGGGGTYGVILSMTLKLHPDGPIGGTYLAFDSSIVGLDMFWQGVDLFHASLPSIVDTGSTVLYQFTNGNFIIFALTSPDRSIDQVTQLLTPFISGLTARNITYQYIPSYHTNYYDHFASNFGPLPLGPFPVSQLTSSRLIPRETIAKNPAVVSSALRATVADGNFYLGCLAVNTKAATPAGPNAVLPAWRDALMQCIVVGPWSWTIPFGEMQARERELTDVIMPRLEAATPGSGIYLNEANYLEKDWKNQFYGENYDVLLQVKQKYDPSHVFYATTAVGSDVFKVDGEGRLCEA